MIVVIAVTLGLVGLLGYRALKPPSPKRLESPTGPRVKLGDGRHLAYREFGVPKKEAKHKVIVIHGFCSSKDKLMSLSQELVDDLSLYLVYFDRAGYGDSDPYPSRSVKSEAFDIQELADKLEIGPKFYVIGISLGGYAVWSCLKYIPHRLAGAALVVPFVNYWWPNLPPNLSRETLGLLTRSDQWTFRIAHYVPWLFYWWMTQKWFTSLSMMSGNNAVFTPKDLKIMKASPNPDMEEIVKQGVYESLHRDVMAGFGKWEFDPVELDNPFPDNGSVHIWQGYEDKLIPYQINRFISEKLPWIRYHEVSDGGHAFVLETHMSEAVFKKMLLP